MQRILLILAIALAAIGINANPADAGLFITIDISPDSGPDGAGYSDPADPPVPSTGFAIASVGGITITVTSTVSEEALESGISSSSTISIAGAGTGTARIRVLYTEIDLPIGTPLLLVSTVASDAPDDRVTFASNESFLGAGLLISLPNPSGGLLSSIDGSPDSDSASGLRARAPGEFDLLQDVIVSFDLPADVVPAPLTSTTIAQLLFLRPAP